jgi:hypothetical protein
LIFKHKYFLDLSDLQYKKIRLPWKSKLIRFTLFSVAALAATFIYSSVFNGTFGSPKEKKLGQEIENLKLKYSIMGMSINNALNTLSDLELSDGNRYRPVLDMDSVPASMRNMGSGGVEKYDELVGYFN